MTQAALTQSPTMAAPLTAEGTIVGTFQYMSPEQLEGKEADARSDIWGLGCVLYEMATGRRAFPVTNAARLLSAILNERPAPPSSVAAGVPPAFDALVGRLLEKDPEHRPRSARETSEALESIAGSPPSSAARQATSPASRGAGIQSILVLPLENLSGDPEQEFFADGMTEELIADLAQIQALRVISRTSAMRYRGATKPLPEIARELGADVVVEGSVLRVGDRVRITAQLIEAASDRHLWAERYEREGQDVIALQGDVALAVAQQIRAGLTPAERASISSPRKVNPEAHELYLKARFSIDPGTRHTVVELRQGLAMG